MALITGASGGLGFDLAQQFAGEGFSVGAHYCSNTERAQRLKESLSTRDVRCELYRADFTDTSSIIAMFAQLRETFGRLDVLVNNAGISRDAEVLDLDDETWEEVMAVNLRGAFLASREALKLMFKQKSGHIINICSIVGLEGRIHNALYAPSKAALLGFTKSLAAEVGRRNIRVNAVLPPYMLTSMVGKVEEERLALHRKKSCLGRIGDTKEVAECIVNLARAENVSGQIISLDSRIIRW